MSYTVTTDPSGSDINLLTNITYTNNSLKPTHNVTYDLRDKNGNVVSDNFVPFSSPRGMPRPGFLKSDASLNLYTADYAGYVSILDQTTFILTSVPIQQKTLLTTNVYGIVFDSNGIIYVSTCVPRINSFDISVNILPSFITNESAEVTVSSTTNIIEGDVVSGNTGITAGTTVLSVDSPTSITISSPATETAGPINLTYSRTTTFYTNFSAIYKINQTAQSLSLFNISNVTINEARGMVFDNSGNLYIADKGNNVIVQVKMIDYNNGVGSIYIPYFAGLNGPNDVIFDKLGKNLYIANTNDNNIIKSDASGNITTFATGPSFNFPSSLRFDNNGILYVTNFGTTSSDGSIVRITNGIVSDFPVVFPSILISCTYQTTSKAILADDFFDESFSDVRIGMTVTGLGIPPMTVVVEIYSTSGEFIINNFPTIDANSELSFSEAIRHPYGIEIDASNNMYVTNSIYGNELYVNGMNQIFKIPIVFTLSSKTELNVTQITALQFNPASLLYVAEYSRSTGLPYDPSLNPVYNGSIWDIENTNYYNAETVPILKNPTSVVFDSDGNLYAANVKSNNIIKIAAPDTGEVYIDNTTFSCGIFLNNPCSLAFDNTFSYLYICNYFGNNIVQVDFTSPITTSSGKILTIIGGIVLSKPNAIVFDGQNNLYISNSGKNNIIKVSNISTPPTPSGTGTIYNDLVSGSILSDPFSICFDPYGNLYVSNDNNKSIVMITNDGFVSYFRYESYITSPLFPSIPIMYPSCLLLDNNGHIYLADAYEFYKTVNSKLPYIPVNNIYDLAPTYEPQNVYDTTYDSFESAFYLISDKQNNIFVSSSSSIYKYANNDIVDYSTNPLIFGQIAMAYNPIDLTNTMYTLDASGSNIYTIDSTGEVVIQFIITGTTLQKARDIIFDSVGNMYVANYGANNILKINLTSITSGTSTDLIISTPDITIKYPNRLAIDTTNNLYIGHDTVIDFSNNFVIKVNDVNSTSPYSASKYVTIPFYPSYETNPFFLVSGITIDKNGYLYVMQTNYNQRFTVLYKSKSPVSSPTNSLFQLSLISPNNMTTSLKYYPFDNSLLVSQNGTNDIDKYFLSFSFNVNDTNLITAYDNTLTIHLAFVEDYYGNATVNTVMDPSSSNLTVPSSSDFSLINLGSLVTGTGIPVNTINPSPPPLNSITNTFLTSSTKTVSISAPTNVATTEINPLNYSSLITKFDVYTNYIYTDPSSVSSTIPGILSVSYINPLILPDPDSTYILTRQVGSLIRPVSSAMINNQTIIGSLLIPSSTYPTGIIYDPIYNEMYVTMQNNTISNITTTNDISYNIYNNYIGVSGGLQGPICPVSDNNGNLYILNSQSNFITKIQFSGGQIILDNSFFTGIKNPIYLTIDYYNNDALYLLSGSSPSFIITKIPIASPSSSSVLRLELGSLNDPKSLSVSQYIVGYNFLYIGDTTPTGINVIYKINLGLGPDPVTKNYSLTIFYSGLKKPATSMTNKNDGYLYTANNYANTISKIAIDVSGQTVDPWMTTCIYNPTGLTFDSVGSLIIANGGTNPNNNKISKVYTDKFFFSNVVAGTPTGSSIPFNIFDKTDGYYVGQFNLNVT